MLAEVVEPDHLVKLYGGSPPPVDQPGLEEVSKSNFVVGGDDGEGGAGSQQWVLA